MIEDCIENTPTADLETLPIVRKLQKELSIVKAERDAVVKKLKGIGKTVNELDNFIDDEICNIVPYGVYIYIKQNVDAILINFNELFN